MNDATLDEKVLAAHELYLQHMYCLPTERASWLEALAAGMEANTLELIEIAMAETHLSRARFETEIARTIFQLRMFAEVVREGSFLEIMIDKSRTDLVPARPELRRVLFGLGVVGVFSASNFPFAFSVLGGDTASALAAGCPVIVKAHSGHPRLSARVAEISRQALKERGAPENLIQIVFSRQDGIDLVSHPLVKGVGFTGSIPGGRALFDIAVSRPDPIPFYGELGSLNPVVVTAEALASRIDEIVTGYVSAFTDHAGQLCTKPGLLFVPAGSQSFYAALANKLFERTAQIMLTDRIQVAFTELVDELAGAPDRVKFIFKDQVVDPNLGITPAVALVKLEDVAADPEFFLKERFGPFGLIIEYGSLDEAAELLGSFEGNLTATIQTAENENVRQFSQIFAQIAGRVIMNQWPTGTAVAWSQMHGGPWPATTAAFTSVGATAVRRFQRPVVFQNSEEEFMPSILCKSEYEKLPYRLDGKLVLPSNY